MFAIIRQILIALGLLAAGAALLPAASAAGDPAAGAKAFQVCAACHSLRPDLNMTGPSLAGIWDRKAGTLATFDRYSAAIKASGLTWDATTLDAWLANPAEFVPGNWMTFAGMSNRAARADLIAFLREIGDASNGAPTVAIPSVYTATPKSLRQLPPDQQVKAIRSCRDSYFVTTADGRTRPFWDQSLRFETDSSEFGPNPEAPVILPSGMFGDRAAVIFSDPAEISGFITRRC